MKNGLISWLVKNHIKHERDIDKVLGALAFVVRQDGVVKVQGANSVFEKMLGWTNYLWSQGMDIVHLMPPEAQKRFCAVLDAASQKVFVEFTENIMFRTLMGTVITCRIHVCCVSVSPAEASYVMRVSYNKQEQIKEALFTEALRQSRVNCWYWDMSQGSVIFFNTDIPEEPHAGVPFMNEECVSFENFPQGMVDVLKFVGDSRTAFMDFVKKLLTRGQSEDLSLEMALETDDGRQVWVSFTGQIVRDEKHTPEYVMGTWKNITDQKADEKHKNCLMGTLRKESVYDITVNLDKNYFVADSSLEKWMEETRVFSPYYDQAIRELVNERVVKEDRQKLLDFFNLDTLRELPDDENFSIEYQRRYNGKTNWFKVTINTFCLDEFSDKWMYALVYDIDASKQRELVLERMAATDALTGLYNRAHSLELMEQYIKEHADMPTAVMYMDLDNFKNVNDTLGHAAGDSLLICVANAMRSYFGNDAVLGRIGGDEFIMMYLNADKSYVGQMMSDFVNYVGDKCRAECPDVGVTVSLGYVLHPDFGDDVAMLADLADKALYEAKHHGKNTAVEYNSRMR
ncbi:diguanylate cyclase domain-containing protein [Anaerovibrio sp.]|uniref:diguanylate cyclase domain-containing protein n=1 Tax=Anaerovibrio sp. TaxID=1872532 RepID=UPI003F18581A